jgi:protein TonB
VEGLYGKVIVSFVIDTDGSLVDIKVIKDLGYGTGKEAIRVLKLCPKWTPAVHNGKPVRSEFTLPISINTR